ncbi:MAG: LLM class flavin-dependent oxidoreductase [Acidimicrobiales bacterium]
MAPAADDARRPALSCALPPSRDLPTHARIAEELGYRRLWVYDSPALYGDVWLALGRAAEATSRIGLGTGVAVPSLRHVMVTASAIGAIEELAPGRLVAAFGTGFTARRAMGRPPMRWADLATYVTQLRGLLAGEVVEVDGAACQMIHSPGFGAPRPIDVPLLVAPVGPKGFAVARDSADGVVLAVAPAERLDGPWDIRALLASGTIVGSGEDHTTPRVRAALGPAFVTGYHAVWEWSGPAVDAMPGGAEWRARIEAERPPAQRHLAVHEGHLVVVTDRDRPTMEAVGPALLDTGWTGDAGTFRDHLDRAGEAGVTEVLLTPAGPDIAAQLEAFAAAGEGASG